MKVVLPTNQQIGPWQARAAHLLALAEKARAGDRRDTRLGSEAEALLSKVERHQEELRKRMRDLPSDVAGSSRLEDTGRALHSVESVLLKTLAVLGIERGRAAAGQVGRRKPTRAGSPPRQPDREARPVPPRP